MGSKHTADAPVFSRYLRDKPSYSNQIDLYIEIPLSVLKEICPQEVREVTAVTYVRESEVGEVLWRAEQFIC